MITAEQTKLLVKKYKINQSVILREYFQILFLKGLYSFSKSQKIYFKGGTALHLLYKAERFSEDLDFTAGIKAGEFSDLISKVFKKLSSGESVSFKERKTIAGKRFLLTAEPADISYKIFVNLDFSFREKVIEPERSILETDFPVIFTSYVHHLSKEEIFAEKIRAIMTRKKGRDLYDLWFLLSQGVTVDNQLIKEKLKYYHLKPEKNQKIIQRLKEFNKKEFVLDLRPYVPIGEREKLDSFFDYIEDFLQKKFRS